MIDLRSDLCSRPTEEMWDAMRNAELGWATYGEDVSVNTLCERVASLLGKDAAVWVPTCGMANLAAMLTFCERGDRVVLESTSHVLTSEASGIIEVAGLEPARDYWYRFTSGGQQSPVGRTRTAAARGALDDALAAQRKASAPENGLQTPTDRRRSDSALAVARLALRSGRPRDAVEVLETAAGAAAESDPGAERSARMFMNSGP